MTPFFDPEPHNYSNSPIYIADVNKQRDIKEMILPNVQRGLKIGNRQRNEIEMCSTIFTIPANDTTPAAQHEADVRQQIAFYAGTPSYRPALELHGRGDVLAKLGKLAAQKRWAELPQKIRAKYSGGLLDRVSYYLPFTANTPGEIAAQWQTTISGFKNIRS